MPNFDRGDITSAIKWAQKALDRFEDGDDDPDELLKTIGDEIRRMRKIRKRTIQEIRNAEDLVELMDDGTRQLEKIMARAEKAIGLRVSGERLR